jgi:CheY-like chemotaxis protein
VQTDAVLIERICRNLGMNALRYTAKGRVLMRLRRVGSQAQLSIADTGVGIARADWERVFEPFLQLRNPARDRTRGLGLGLTIVRELSALLGAGLRMRSQPGRGTVFTLRLPLSERPGPDAQMRNPEAWRHLLDGALILVIDDDARSREATALTLRDFGCEVVSAASSLQALAAPALAERLPSLILSDYRLEHETGLEAIDRVRSGLDDHFGDQFAIPGLLFSGDTAPEQLRRVRDAGLLMLHKPVAPETLRAALERELAVLAGLAMPLAAGKSGI